MDKPKSIGAWIKKSRNGIDYISFKIDGVYYSMFKNNYKKEDKQPDYNLYKSEKQNEQLQTSTGNVSSENKQANDTSDDLPF